MNRKRERQETLAAEIRRQIGAPQTTRYLRSLPQFEVPHNDNERFETLLRRVDRAAAKKDGRPS
jgi:hypothetical protein